MKCKQPRPQVLLIHPESMPAIRNRAVFQRPFFFSQNAHLEILTTEDSEICHEIADRSTIHRLKGANNWPFIPLLVWKFFVILWIVRLRISANFVPMTVYAYPQWGGWFILTVARLLGFIVIVDMQHTPLYYREYKHSQSLNLINKLYL